MIHNLIQQMAEIPFFSSLAFGIIAMIIVGSSWCLIGFVMGDAPKHNIDPGFIQFLGSIVSVIIGVSIMFATDSLPTNVPARVLWPALGALFLGSLLNFFMLQIMSYAMQRGPNGIIWAIIQSALISPAVCSYLIFKQVLSSYQIIGICLIVIALILFSFAKDNSNKGNGWKLPTAVCFILVSIQQNLTTAPSYYPDTQAISSIVRALASAFGILIPSLIFMIRKVCAGHINELKTTMKNPVLWKYVIALQGFTLLFAYTLFYPGFDAMSNYGASGMCYPMMVGSCIISFTLTSVLILKEKLVKIQFFALIFCILGFLGLCFPVKVLDAFSNNDQPAAEQFIGNAGKESFSQENGEEE